MLLVCQSEPRFWILTKIRHIRHTSALPFFGMSFIMSSILSQKSFTCSHLGFLDVCLCLFLHIGVHVCLNLIFRSDTVSPHPLDRCMQSKAVLLCPASVPCHSFRRDNKPEPVTSTLTFNLQGSTWCSGLWAMLGRLQFSRHRVPKNGSPCHSDK